MSASARVSTAPVARVSASQRAAHDCVLQRLRMVVVGTSALAVAAYVLTQLYAECTLTEWSAWGPL